MRFQREISASFGLTGLDSEYKHSERIKQNYYLDCEWACLHDK